MVEPVLAHADLALWSDPGATRVVIPYLMSATSPRVFPGVVVTFAGDTYGTPFRGETKARSWDLTARYGRDKQQEAYDLIELIELAADSPDQRLLLRTHYGLVAGLNDLAAVVVRQVDPVPNIGLYWDVSFTAVQVDATVGA